MILSGKEIEFQVGLGNITIDPFELGNVNPNSYNYRLGDLYAAVPQETASLGSRPPRHEIRAIPDEGLILRPHQVYLATTYETIGSNRFVTLLSGRSSVGRLGLFLQLSADLGNLGPAHKWTLELTCVQPVIIYPRMRIGQLSFWVPSGAIAEYVGPYTHHDTPKECLYAQLFQGEP
jgi:dCTP deaminase